MDTKPLFEDVVATHGATVLRVCRAVVGPDDADDAWTDTFISALRAWPDLPVDANVEAWLVTIAHRRAIDHVRARARRAVPTAELPERAAAPATAPLDDDLRDAVAALPTAQRLAVAYHHLAGLPHAEVATITGSTPTAVRRAASDGIRALRRTIVGPASAGPTSAGPTSAGPTSAGPSAGHGQDRSS